MRVSFKELREKLISADHQALEDWQTRLDDWRMGAPSLEERLSFVEHRHSMVAGAVSAILTELIARDEELDELLNLSRSKQATIALM